METLKVATWEDFLAQLSSIPTSYPLLFRGHSRCCWPLDTTLERTTRTNCSFYQYYNTILRIVPDVQAFTGLPWDTLPQDNDELRCLLKTHDFKFRLVCCDIPAYDFMIYLRQHGFPSPLLDWSRSPYIAAYFAFANSNSTKSENVAIYILSESDEGSAQTGHPTIYSLRRNVKSHKRHFLQQAVYTVCATFSIDDEWRLSPHQTAVDSSESHQFVFRKYIIPATERIKALKFLDKVNLNASSLFESEEGLMETLKFREFDFT